MAKFPLYLSKVNVAVYTFQMLKILNTHQIPYCCLLNERFAIQYKGPISTINYSIIISRLNEMNIEPKVAAEHQIQKTGLQNKELSLILSGLGKKVEGVKKPNTVLEKIDNSKYSNSSRQSITSRFSSENSSQQKIYKQNDDCALELSYTQLPLLKNLKNYQLPNNCQDNVEALKRVQIIMSIKANVQQVVDEWED
ncbi:Conserved_hypothetical protein [Hexamita inflata]|uniref:Uncharacterized protein n=1 Tax=Hexamita inflata TaxID=28002 RepID=A0AA86TDI6_9EUKA|nr:Conserved hypothetical protein [Hexamita inflata]